MSQPRGRVKVEDSAKRIRGYLGGEQLFDTIRPKLVWEIPPYPAYYLPAADVRTEVLTSTGHTEHSPSRGEARYFTVEAGGVKHENGAWQYPDSPIEELRGLIRFAWDSLDHWFEEDEEVYVHPRNPYSRVDILPSSRHVRVELDGVTVAETRKPTLLFETGLPPRYYLPLTDLRIDLLRPSATHSRCPYKGTASYWTVDTGAGRHEDIVWTYPTALPESQKIAGLACFYNEHSDIYVDGVLQDRPQTPFSKRRNPEVV
jgi:uncharacterized protein (DUF427 family)